MAAVSVNFPSDFFTPSPRQLKGKERALPNFGWSTQESGGHEQYVFSAAVSSGSPCASVACRSAGTVPSRGRVRRSHSQRPRNLPLLHAWLHRADVSQRRHASNRSIAPHLVLKSPPPDNDPGASTPLLSESMLKDIRRWQDLVFRVKEFPEVQLDFEDTWTAYQRFRAQAELTFTSASGILLVARNFLWAMKSLPPDQTWKHWTSRIIPLLVQLESIVSRRNELRIHAWDCLMAQANAFAGNFEDALVHLEKVKGGKILHTSEELNLVRTYEALFLAMDHHLGATAVMEFIIQDWNNVGSYLCWRPNTFFRWPIRPPQKSLRQTAADIISNIERPTDMLVDLSEHWSDGQRTAAGEYLIEVVSRHPEECEEALAVMKEMYDLDVEPSMLHRILVVKALAKANKKRLSTELFLSLYKEYSEEHQKDIQSCGLFVFARQGDVERAETFFNQLSGNGTLHENDVAAMLHGHAVNGDYQRAEKMFNDYCLGLEGRRTIFPPNIYHWTSVLLAHAEGHDYDALNVWLNKMIKAGIRPDHHVYSILVETLVQHDNVQDIIALMDQMRKAGFPPNRFTYTSIISLLARKQDPEAADAIYRRAIAEGVRPDGPMLNTLMNAHVEAGSWRGAILAFDYMKNSRTRFNIDVWNTLLKAYILIGAPFRVVSALFAKLDEVGMEPDDRSFALMIQCACDAGRMRTAINLFSEMVRMTKNWPSDLTVNGYVLTIIMAGYLRMKDKVRAKAVFDDMRARNIDPTSVTYAIILRAYGNEKSQESIQIAEDFLTSLLEAEESQKGWLNSEGGRARALADVFTPIISAWRRKVRPEEAERVFQKMLDNGGRPTLGSLTTILDAHRRKRNVEAVRELWPQIVELGVEYSEEMDPLFSEEGVPKPPEGRRHSNILCIPFSIYIDAMSSSGYHAEIAKAWGELQMKGFTLDSHNWNHLAVALIRAGEPERAFEILERVILKYRQQTVTLTPRDKVPSSPLLSDLPEHFQEIRDVPHDESPLRSMQKRANRAGLVGKKVKPWMTDLTQNDFAHPLHILHSVSPGWNIWRPHNTTMYLLGRSLAHLQAGDLIQPLLPGEDPDVAALTSRATSVEELHERNALAGQILNRIIEHFPDTVAAVLEYEQWQLNRSHKSRLQTQRFAR